MNNSIQHIGLIPDGARRWAEKSNNNQEIAYITTMDRLIEIILYLYNIEIKNISIYLSSLENVQKRNDLNKHHFLNSQKHFIQRLLSNVLNDLDINIVISGNTSLLPLEFQQALNKLQSKGTKKSDKTLNLLIAYNPIDEINSAISKEGKLDFKNLQIPLPIDIVIRTGVKGRLSNFLPLQTAYSELFFIDKFFPEITVNDVESIIDTFQNRLRNFGE